MELISSIVNFYDKWILDHSNDDKYLNNPEPTNWDILKYYVIKYRRIIGFLLLIIFIYHLMMKKYTTVRCGDYVIYSQSGGMTMKESASDKIASIKSDTKYDVSSYKEKKRAEFEEKKKSIKQAARTAVKSVGPTGLYRGGKAVIERGVSTFSSYSDFIYTMLYQIAFAIIICLIFLPSAVFVIGGVICFTLLRSKINYIKSL
jgi:hypothetical protein